MPPDGDAPDEMMEIIHDFLVESNELLEGLEQQFIELENDPCNKDLLNDIFRSMHTVKGSAGFLGFTKLVDVAHHSENILNKLRQGEISASQGIIDVILEASDIIKDILENLKEGSEGDVDVTGIVARLDSMLSEPAADAEAQPEPVQEEVAAEPPCDDEPCEEADPEESPVQATQEAAAAQSSSNLFDDPDFIDPFADPEAFKKSRMQQEQKAQEENVATPAEPKSDELTGSELDEMVAREMAKAKKKALGTIKEPATTKSSGVKKDKKTVNECKAEKKAVTEELTEAVEKQEPESGTQTVQESDQAIQAQPGPPKPGKVSAIAKQKPESSPIIRVEADRLDNVMNLVGEVVLNRNRALKLASELDERYDNDDIVRTLNETVAQLSRVTTDLQLAVMKTRMIPLGRVLNKYPRMVRDLSRQVGKKVILEISGEDTELDKSVVDVLGDPLVHLIRNSIDHGIETPEERLKKGKPEEGTIIMAASQEGNNIVIRVTDDGRGLDFDAIKSKAVEKGLYTEKELSVMREEELADIIFMAGFSTKKVATDLSGRGVGMDVVKSTLKKVNGFVFMSPVKEGGTQLTIKLPLTIAIIQALMVKVESEVFAIPLVSVLETVKITRANIKTIDGRMVLNLREHVLPLVNLRVEFGVEPVSDEVSKNFYVVVVTVGERMFGLLVNKLLRQEEVVIKSMGSYLSDIRGVCGATITGEGKVVLILDVAEVIGMIQNGRSMMIEDIEHMVIQ